MRKPKSLEQQFFSVSFRYDSKFVDKLVLHLHEATKPKHMEGLKWLIFKMMKDIVKKNSLNYLNLLRKLPDSSLFEIPTIDDLIFDCIDVYDRCIKNYEIGSNFYFYYNTALSRYFFRKYQREFDRIENITEFENDDRLTNILSYSSNGGVERVELLIDLLQFSPLEKEICLSRCNGERTEDFVKRHKDVSSSAYTKAMKNIKKKLSDTLLENE